jgi:hypothetical protein
MPGLEGKIVQILQILSSMPAEARLLAVRRILPDGYAVVPQQCSPDMQHAFVSTAQRLHEGLKTKLEFAATALPSCWGAMLVRAEHQIADECRPDHLPPQASQPVNAVTPSMTMTLRSASAVIARNDVKQLQGLP